MIQAVYVDSRTAASKLVEYIRYQKNYDMYQTTTIAGSYVWQIQRSELLYTSMVRFFNLSCYRNVKISHDFRAKMRDQLFSVSGVPTMTIPRQLIGDPNSRTQKPFDVVLMAAGRIDEAHKVPDLVKLSEPTTYQSSENIKKVSRDVDKQLYQMTEKDLIEAINGMVAKEDYNKVDIDNLNDGFTITTVDSDKGWKTKDTFKREFSKSRLGSNPYGQQLHSNEDDYLEFYQHREQPVNMYMMTNQSNPQESSKFGAQNDNTGTSVSQGGQIQSSNGREMPSTGVDSFAMLIGNYGIANSFFDQQQISQQNRETSSQNQIYNDIRDTTPGEGISPFITDQTNSNQTHPNSISAGQQNQREPPGQTPRFADGPKSFFNEHENKLITNFNNSPSNRLKLLLFPDVMISAPKAKISDFLRYFPKLILEKTEYLCELTESVDPCTFRYSLPLLPLFMSDLPGNLLLQISDTLRVNLQWYPDMAVYYGHAEQDKDILATLKPIELPTDRISGLTAALKEGECYNVEIQELKVMPGFGVRAKVIEFQAEVQVVIVEESSYHAQERIGPPQYLRNQKSLCSTIDDIDTIELPYFCKAVLGKLGTKSHGSELFYESHQGAEDYCYLLGYFATHHFPGAVLKQLSKIQFATALQSEFPGTFNNNESLNRTIDSLDKSVTHNDLVDFYNEDLLNFMVSSWGKDLIPRRLESPEEVTQLILAKNIAKKVMTYYFSSMIHFQQQDRHQIYNVFLLDKSKVLLEVGMPAEEAFHLLYWIEICLFGYNMKRCHLSLNTIEYSMTFLKVFLREVDKDTFNSLTDQSISLDSLIMPFLMSNFSILAQSHLITKFWKMQLIFSRFSLNLSSQGPQEESGTVDEYLGPMSVFHLLQIWLIIDSMDSIKFNLPSLTQVDLSLAQNLLKEALLYNLSLPWDQLLYSASNFIFDTLSKLPGAKRLASDLLTIERRSMLGTKKLADGVAKLNARLNIAGSDLSRVVDLWFNAVTQERGLGSQNGHLRLTIDRLLDGPDTGRGSKSEGKRGRGMDSWKCEEVLKQLMTKNAIVENKTGLNNPENFTEKVDTLNFLSLNGVIDPTISRSSDIQFENIATSWSFEDIATFMKSEMRDENFFKLAISRLLQSNANDSIGTTIFELFKKKSKQPSDDDSTPVASLATFLLATISSLHESSVVKKRQLVNIALFFQEVANCSLSGYSSDQEEPLSYQVVTAILHCVSTFNSLQVPLTQLASQPLKNIRPSLIRASMGTSLILSTPLTSLISKISAYKYCTTMKTNTDLDNRATMATLVGRASARLLPGAENGAVVRMTFMDADGKIVGRKVEIGEDVAGLGEEKVVRQESRGVSLLGKNQNAQKSQGNFSSSKKYSEEELLCMLDQLNCFYTYELTFTNIEQYDNYAIPTTILPALNFEVYISGTSIGFFKILTKLDMEVYRDPYLAMSPPQISQGSSGRHTYTITQPLCILLQPTFSLTILVRHYVTQILASSISEDSINMKHALSKCLFIIGYDPGAVGDQNSQARGNLKPEHSLLSNEAIKKQIASSNQVDLIAYTISTNTTSN